MLRWLGASAGLLAMLAGAAACGSLTDPESTDVADSRSTTMATNTTAPPATTSPSGVSNESEGRPYPYEVPDVVGLTVGEARDLLQAEGLNPFDFVTPCRRQDGAVVAGTIVGSQEPEAGAPAHRGLLVELHPTCEGIS